MKIQLNFDGTLLVEYEPQETYNQMKFLLHLEPETEEEASMVQNVINQVLENEKHMDVSKFS